MVKKELLISGSWFEVGIKRSEFFNRRIERGAGEIEFVNGTFEADQVKFTLFV